jgi:hypothetical protein
MKKPPDHPSREAIWKISICLGVLFLVSLACSTGDQGLLPTSPPVQKPTVPAEQGGSRLSHKPHLPPEIFRKSATITARPARMARRKTRRTAGR